MTTNENEILQEGIQLLERLGLRTKECVSFNTAWADYIIELSPKNSNKSTKYFVEIKTNVTNATLSQWILDLKVNKKEASNNLILLTRYMTSTLGEKLREMEISYLDTSGNAYFNDPLFYIYVTGKKLKERKSKSISLFRPAGIKLLLHLLSQPGLEANDYRDLAEITGVPKTSIGEVMNDLERLNFLVFYKNKRRLTNKPELLRRWVEAFTENYRSKLVRGKFRAPEGNTDWWEMVSVIQFQACWGGEIAAQKLVGHIKPKAAVIYADSLLPMFQAKYGLRRDPSGNVEILKKFWTAELDYTAPPLVVYADLIFSSDARNLETARMIYEKYLSRLIEDAPK